jgi:hypothetical protein
MTGLPQEITQPRYEKIDEKLLSLPDRQILLKFW